jgi:hypothetical protein
MLVDRWRDRLLGQDAALWLLNTPRSKRWRTLLASPGELMMWLERLVGSECFAVDASLIQADASDRTRVEGAAGLPPDAAGRTVEEYLAVLDDAAFGAASEVTPKFIAPSDPATRWTAAHRGPAFFAYSAN